MNDAVAKIMTKMVRTVLGDDTVEKVENEMTRLKLHAVPVVDAKGAVFGIISSVDVVNFHVAKRNAKAVKAWELCTYKPISVSPQTPMKEVASIMVNKRIHHVLVTEDNTLKGIVSTFDFLEHSFRQS
jgi:CBS domain-containing protein